MRAISQAAGVFLTDSCRRRSAGDADWWRLREAAILAVGVAAEQLREVEEEGRVQRVREREKEHCSRVVPFLPSFTGGSLCRFLSVGSYCVDMLCCGCTVHS